MFRFRCVQNQPTNHHPPSSLMLQPPRTMIMNNKRIRSRSGSDEENSLPSASNKKVKESSSSNPASKNPAVPDHSQKTHASTRPIQISANSQKFLWYLMYEMQVENESIYTAIKNWLLCNRNDVDLEFCEPEHLRNTPIIIAAKKSWLRIVRLLVSLKANVNATNDWNKTALIYIASFTFPEHVSTARLLIENKADVNKCDNWGRTALSTASITNNISMVCLLLEHKADTESRNNAGRTPLLETCLTATGTLEMAECLVNVGLSNVSGTDKYGQTSLQCATISGKMRIVKFLIHQQKCKRYNPVQDEEKALICAVQYNHIQLVTYYIEERKVDINCKDDEDHTTPLMTSVYIANIDMVKLLLSFKADTEARDIYGKSALDRALNGGIFGDNDANVVNELVSVRHSMLKNLFCELEILGIDGINQTAEKIHAIIIDYTL